MMIAVGREDEKMAKKGQFFREKALAFYLFGKFY
jgi:hypothetical protein